MAADNSSMDNERRGGDEGVVLVFGAWMFALGVLAGAICLLAVEWVSDGAVSGLLRHDLSHFPPLSIIIFTAVVTALVMAAVMMSMGLWIEMREWLHDLRKLREGGDGK